MKYFRSFLLLAAFVGLALHGQAQKTTAAKALIKRTYYDYQGRQLHEEYQYIRTANQLVVKYGYYKEYTEGGIIKAKANYRNDELDGTVTTYENWGNGPEPFEIDHYKTGKRHGYSALYWFNDEGKRLLEHEGSYYNGKYDGRWVQYEHDGSKLVENWRRGVRHGETIQYGPTGQKIREGYFNEGQPFSGTLDEQFDNGKLSSSITYEDCFREGPTQTWYPSGTLKTWTQYHRGEQAGPTRQYLKNGEPDEATKVALAQQAAERTAEQADSTKQAQQVAVARQRQLLEHHVQDSVRRANEAKANANWAEAQNLKTAEIMLARAYAKQQTLVRSGAQSKLCINLYNRLTADYEATAGAAKLPKAQRLLALVNLAEALYQGEQPELNKAIRKEADLDKVLALTGL